MRGARGRVSEGLLRCSERRAHALDDGALRADAVVVAPHPDDEVLGCGATIASKRAAGAWVTIVLLSDGGNSHAGFTTPAQLGARRNAEAVAAARRLGVGDMDVLFAGGDDGRLQSGSAMLGCFLARVLAERRPAQVLTPCRWDVWPDHQAAYAIARAASQAAPSVSVLLEYAVWFWDGWPWTSGRPGAAATAAARLGAFDRHVVVDGELAATKRAALACHASQTSRPPEHPDWPVLGDLRDGELLGRWLGPRELLRESRLR